MRQYFLPTFFFLLFASCAQPNAGPPPLELGELSETLAELQLAEALTNEIPVIFRDSLREVYYDNVLTERGSNRQEFDSLMWIVRQEPAWVDSLYSRVGDILARRQELGGRK